MASKLIFDQQHLQITINRLCFQLIENHSNFIDTVIIGLQPRGILLSSRILNRLSAILPDSNLLLGELDTSFHRDDFRRREMIVPSATTMNFNIENKKVILIDDVLYTGRTIRSGLDAIQAFGRPAKVELLVLINRKYSRHLPIAPDYIGKSIDTVVSDKIKVQWKETDGQDGVWLLSNERTA